MKCLGCFGCLLSLSLYAAVPPREETQEIKRRRLSAEQASQGDLTRLIGRRLVLIAAQREAEYSKKLQDAARRAD